MLPGAAAGDENIFANCCVFADRARLALAIGGAHDEWINGPARIGILVVLAHDGHRYVVIDGGERRDGRTIFRFLQRLAHLHPQQIGGAFRPGQCQKGFCLAQRMQREIGCDRGEQQRRDDVPAR